jgi:hypothetical protein
MNISIKNITHIKTTIIGVVLLAGAAAHLIYQDMSSSVFYPLLIGGCGFIVAPDSLISSLKSFFKNNEDKKI